MMGCRLPRYAPQSFASYKRRFRDVGQRFGKGQFLNAGTIKESIIAYSLQRLWDIDFFQFVAPCESPVVNLGDVV